MLYFETREKERSYKKLIYVASFYFSHSQYPTPLLLTIHLYIPIFSQFCTIIALMFWNRVKYHHCV